MLCLWKLLGSTSPLYCTVYFFSNMWEQQDAESHLSNVLFAKLISVNSPYFDFEACDFSEKSMSSKDKSSPHTHSCTPTSMSSHSIRSGMYTVYKEGAGRVAIFKLTGIVHCYTLEFNYNSGSRDHLVRQVDVPRHGSRRRTCVSPQSACILYQVGGHCLPPVKNLHPYSTTSDVLSMWEKPFVSLCWIFALSIQSLVSPTLSPLPSLLPSLPLVQAHRLLLLPRRPTQMCSHRWAIAENGSRII